MTEFVKQRLELVVRQADDEVLNRAGREEQQQRAADQLEEAVEPLEDDADFERDVKFRACYLVPPSSAARAAPTA